MWQDLVFELAKLIFLVASTAIGSGWIVTALTQLLKWKAIAIPAQKYPTVIAVILSLVLAVPAVLLTGLVTAVGWPAYVVIAFASILVSVQTYDTIKAAIDQIKSAKK